MPAFPGRRLNVEDRILVEGARQNNLRNLSLALPLGELIVVTGVSGSGKSSLAFDTVYAEGQRRYVETFSPYARQFLERMDKPAVDAIRGIPPAIAIDQTNPVRTSRSTVGTMTELNDYLKLLFARSAVLHCRGCGEVVRHDSADSVADALLGPGGTAGEAVEIRFAVELLPGIDADQMRALLTAQGYARLSEESGRLVVVQDRLRLTEDKRSRLAESLETAFRLGRVRLSVLIGREETRQVRRFSAGLHCAHCDIAYQATTPNSFSFNSPVGACETCRGFGRTIGIDYGLVIPDPSKSLAGGAIKPWQTQSFDECQKDLLKYGRKRGIPLDIPWASLAPADREWVVEGEGEIDSGRWYGIRRFFTWLETKSYKMHLRVLLSKYRSYDECRACGGARLKAEALL
ncbi:MAG: excinuclease ABC subunit A, partial [Gammaproteobacteria bacterium]